MTDDEKRELIVTARHLEEMWKKAEHPFSETEFLESDALAELHATGFVAVQNARRLADALEGTLTGPDTVSTIEELDALPIGSVVMECQAEPFLGIPTVAGVFHKFPLAVQEPGRTSREGWREWYVVAGHGARPASEIQLPAQVLRKGGA